MEKNTSKSRRIGVYVPSKSRKKEIEEEQDEEQEQEQEHKGFIPTEQGKKESRRTGVYIPGYTRRRILELDERKQIQSFWKEQIHALQRIQRQIKEEEKEKDLLKRKNIQWKYIQTPSITRQTIVPSDSNIIKASVEKTSFGDYLYMNYLEKVTDHICFITPDLKDAIDAIQMVYLIQNQNITFPLNDWKDIYPLISETELKSLYVKTYPWIAPNYPVFVSLLKINSKGPRVKINNDEKIFLLITYLLERFGVRLDINQDYKFNFPDTEKMIKCLEDTNIRYIVFFFILILKKSGHANMMILDKYTKQIERFEPHGINHRLYDEKRVDRILYQNFKNLGYEYIGPVNLCPLGVQSNVDRMAIKVYHYTGFCKTWSLLYALFRLTMGDEVDPKTLSEQILEYTKKIAEEYIEETYGKGLDIEEENQDLESRKLITEFLYDFIPEILDYGKEEVEKINQAFGTTLALDGRSIVSKE